jgi:hypothetical protein
LKREQSESDSGTSREVRIEHSNQATAFTTAAANQEAPCWTTSLVPACVSALLSPRSSTAAAARQSKEQEKSSNVLYTAFTTSAVEYR